MNKVLYVSFLLLLAIFLLHSQRHSRYWECNMEIEILSGRFTPGDTVAARGDFNSGDVMICAKHVRS